VGRASQVLPQRRVLVQLLYPRRGLVQSDWSSAIAARRTAAWRAHVPAARLA